MGTNKNKVVTFGEIMVRLGAPGYLKLIQTDKFEVSYAGAEANVAVSLANYGVETDYITCLPGNPIAERCIMDLRGHKVGVDHIQRTGKRMGILYLETGSNARPSKVYYDREDSSFATVVPDSIDWKDILKDATWFHWTGITPALSKNAASECLKAIKTANELGITVSCDINYRANLWKYGKAASEVMPEMVAGSDIILGNEEDCEKVSYDLFSKSPCAISSYGPSLCSSVEISHVNCKGHMSRYCKERSCGSHLEAVA